MTAHEFLDARMSLAARYGYRVNSEYRSAEQNAALGGVHFSAHQFFLAVDVILVHPDEQAEFIEASARLGLLVIDEGDHLHLQPLDWKAG